MQVSIGGGFLSRDEPAVQVQSVFSLEYNIIILNAVNIRRCSVVTFARVENLSLFYEFWENHYE